jgi:hypothetical protein
MLLWEKKKKHMLIYDQKSFVERDNPCNFYWLKSICYGVAPGEGFEPPTGWLTAITLATQLIVFIGFRRMRGTN